MLPLPALRGQATRRAWPRNPETLSGRRAPYHRLGDFLCGSIRIAFEGRSPRGLCSPCIAEESFAPAATTRAQFPSELPRRYRRPPRIGHPACRRFSRLPRLVPRWLRRRRCLFRHLGISDLHDHLQEPGQKRFFLIDFYARRIRRIFPALLVVLVACFVVGRHVLFDSELRMLGRHIAAGAGFVQNFVLWNEAGYFDVVSEAKPMLHLWSLAVEEQFYLVFPLLMWAAWRLHINLLIPVIVIFLASFAANLYGIRHDAVATFFAPQTRFWELMAGAMLA